MARSGRGWDAKPPPAPATRGRAVANRRRGPALPTSPDSDDVPAEPPTDDPVSRAESVSPAEPDPLSWLADPAWVREARSHEADPARLREAMEQFAAGLDRRSQRGSRSGTRRGDRQGDRDRPGDGWDDPGTQNLEHGGDGRAGRGGRATGGGRGAGERGAGERASGGERGAGGRGAGGGGAGGRASGGERGAVERGAVERASGGGRGDGARDKRGAAGEPESRDPQEVAREICLRLLAVRPRTRAELAQALRKRGIDNEAASAVLNRYDEVGMIDDAAFARAWVTSRHHGRGLASRALAQELRQRGVSKQDADQALSELDSETEAQTALDLATRRLRSMHGEPEAIFRRLVGMLARKGYPPGVTLRAVKEALASRDSELAELIDPDAYEA